jgi:hypothetical protein
VSAHAPIGALRSLLRRLRTPGREPPLLTEVDPAFAQELEQQLRRKGQQRLAASVSELRVVELCRCGDPKCSSFYVIPRFIVSWRWAAQGETLELDAARGTISVDVVDREIVLVEVLDRPELSRALNAAYPP